MVPLLTAVVEYARAHGAKIVEGYPVEPTQRLSGDSGYTGASSGLPQAGFVEERDAADRGTTSRGDLEDSLEIVPSGGEAPAAKNT
jgi:hypothetical protein